jgi:hypothetical protein
MIIRLVAIYACLVVAICSAPVLAADTTQYQALPNSHIGLVLGMSHSEYKALTGLEPGTARKGLKIHPHILYKLNTVKLVEGKYIFVGSFFGCDWASLVFDDAKLVRIHHCLDHFDEAAFSAQFGNPSYKGMYRLRPVLAWCSLTHAIVVEDAAGIWYQTILYPRRTKAAVASVVDGDVDVICPERKK